LRYTRWILVPGLAAAASTAAADEGG